MKRAEDAEGMKRAEDAQGIEWAEEAQNDMRIDPAGILGNVN